MAGMKFEGTSETTEFLPNQRYSLESKGGIESTFVYEYKPEGEGTRLSIEVENTVPVPVLGKLAEAMIIKMYEREGKTLLANLKDLSET